MVGFPEAGGGGSIGGVPIVGTGSPTRGATGGGVNAPVMDPPAERNTTGAIRSDRQPPSPNIESAVAATARNQSNRR